jgi:hypothetical protein
MNVKTQPEPIKKPIQFRMGFMEIDRFLSSGFVISANATI